VSLQPEGVIRKLGRQSVTRTLNTCATLVSRVRVLLGENSREKAAMAISSVSLAAHFLR
jgi:hypothetical protein